VAALRYAFEEALASLWRGRGAAWLSTAIIAIALFVLGAFLLVSVNLEHLADQWRSGAELSVFLADDVSDQDRRAIEGLLAPGPLVSGSSYVSKSDALARFKEMFKDLARTTDALDRNPLPASYEVQLVPGSSNEAVDGLVARVRQSKGVSDVRYDRDWLDRVTTVMAIVRRIGWILGAILTAAAALTVANVVRLALYARRDELEIMQLVGAPQAYLRGPFVMEGVLQGGVGGLLALAGLALAFLLLRGRLLSPLASAVNLPGFHFLTLELALLLLVGRTRGPIVDPRYRILTPRFRQNYTDRWGRAPTTLHRGPACHAS
jgi:cell division transport system permease protein